MILINIYAIYAILIMPILQIIPNMLKKHLLLKILIDGGGVFLNMGCYSRLIVT